MVQHATILPRVLRLRDAPRYLGMDIHRFNKEVRPSLKGFSIGKQGIGFDRLDLDAWLDQYTKRDERLSTSRGELWDVNTHQGSLKEEGTGISTNSSSDEEFLKILKQARLKKRKST